MRREVVASQVDAAKKEYKVEGMGINQVQPLIVNRDILRQLGALLHMNLELSKCVLRLLPGWP